MTIRLASQLLDRLAFELDRDRRQVVGLYWALLLSSILGFIYGAIELLDRGYLGTSLGSAIAAGTLAGGVAAVSRRHGRRNRVLLWLAGFAAALAVAIAAGVLLLVPLFI